ncbi:MAG TPA: YbaB/EbfC family nucleoid-associated protein [Firmicutes bacterium]|uniref:YbaB/EbfC family nucleoid-associated protein n=1 Tax=Candidatus Fermentithermobacillus carboniphilus TaxID=3085328 RepID=A0AAT9LCP2_9FIRM|nr:MAG: YbaB/EbfC family nucleoid-associated protein [Candidatus Fermentithermobacillus carboniphilus]HHW18915.1 YbaB/EbfC family nucleoid-associated protein [Candidatus Fermentithermobacillaceae bacterium]
MQNLASLLMQMERIESEVNSRLSGLQDKLVQGEAGSGLVTATSDIWFNIQKIHIDREKLAARTYDLATLENVIAEAVNNAIKEARKLLRTEIGGVFGGQVPPEFGNFFGRSGVNG